MFCSVSNSSALHLFHLTENQKTRENVTYFHVLVAGVAEEELVGLQDCWVWRGLAGPEDSVGQQGCAAGPWGFASLSWVLRLGC